MDFRYPYICLLHLKKKKNKLCAASEQISGIIQTD